MFPKGTYYNCLIFSFPLQTFYTVLHSFVDVGHHMARGLSQSESLKRPTGSRFKNTFSISQYFAALDQTQDPPFSYSLAWNHYKWQIFS